VRWCADRLPYAGITRVRSNGRRRAAATFSARLPRAPVSVCDSLLTVRPALRSRQGARRDTGCAAACSMEETAASLHLHCAFHHKYSLFYCGSARAVLLSPHTQWFIGRGQSRPTWSQPQPRSLDALGRGGRRCRLFGIGVDLAGRMPLRRRCHPAWPAGRRSRRRRRSRPRRPLFGGIGPAHPAVCI
jgi:hypothetical protein